MNLLNKKKAKSVIKFLLGFPLTVVSLAFIFRIIYSSWEEISVNLSNVDIPVLLLGLLFLTPFFILKSISWSKILFSINSEVPFNQSYYLMSLSETRRYIPGNIFAVAARISSFEKFGISKKMLFATQVIEMLLLLMASSVVAIPGVFYLRGDIQNMPFPFNFTGVLGELIFVVIFLFLAIAFIFSIFLIRKKLLSLHKSIKVGALIDSFSINILSWIFFGIGNFIVIHSFYQLDIYLLLSLSSFFVLTWLIGFISFVTPMGLGVREVVMTAGLSPLVGGPIAATAAVFARVLLILAELISLILSYLVSKDNKATKYISYWHVIVVVASSVGYFFYFTYYSFLKHANFLTGRFDLGNMDQTVWNTLNGRVFLLTDPNGTSVMSRLGVHADFLLIFLAPLYLLWQDPRMLLMLQSAIIATGAIFVYLLATHILKNKNLAVVFSISFLLNFWVQRQNLFDFHAVALATTFLIATFLFLVKRRYVLFGIFLILSILTKENVWLVVFFFGGYLFIKGHKKAGILLSVVSLVIFYLLVAYFIPAYRPQGDGHFGLSYFEALGNTPFEVMLTALLRPDITTSILIKNGGPYYLFQTLIPTGFLSLFSPLYLIFASGDYLINLISNNIWLRTIFFHYGALIIPFVYISSIYGAKRILAWDIPFINTKSLTYYVLISALISTWLYGVLPGSRWQSVEAIASPYKSSEDVKRVLSLIPQEMSISSSNTLAAHLSYREKIYVIPKGTDADIVAILMRSPYIGSSEEEHNKILVSFLRNYDYSLVYAKEDFYVFSKNKFAKVLEVLFSP